MDSEMALFLPTLTLLLVVAPTVEVYGYVCYVGQEPDQANVKQYGWSLAEQIPCECTEFRLGGLNMKPQIKPYEVTIGEDPRVSISKGQLVRSPDCKEDQHALIDHPVQVAGSLKHVSIGEAGVWGVDVQNSIYYKDGYSWTLTTGKLKQLDVGTNVVWGASRDDHIFYREVSVSNPNISSWIIVQGLLICVSVSQKGHVWGVNRHNHIYHRQDASVNRIAGSRWVQIKPGILKQISIGSGGVWGITPTDKIVYRVGTYGDPDSDPEGSDWKSVAPYDISLKYVSSGDVIYVVDTNDSVYYRVGMSAETPTGTKWQKIDGNLKTIESISGTFWGVDAKNRVYTNASLSYR